MVLLALPMVSRNMISTPDVMHNVWTPIDSLSMCSQLVAYTRTAPARTSTALDATTVNRVYSVHVDNLARRVKFKPLSAYLRHVPNMRDQPTRWKLGLKRF